MTPERSAPITDIILIGPTGAGKTFLTEHWLVPALKRRKLRYEGVDTASILRALFPNQRVEVHETRTAEAYVFTPRMLVSAYRKMISEVRLNSSGSKKVFVYELATDPGFKQDSARLIGEILRIGRVPIFVYLTTPKALCLKNNARRKTHFVPGAGTYFLRDPNDRTAVRQIGI